MNSVDFYIIYCRSIHKVLWIGLLQQSTINTFCFNRICNVMNLDSLSFSFYIYVMHDSLSWPQFRVLYCMLTMAHYKNQWWFIIKENRGRNTKQIKVEKSKFELLGVHPWTVWIGPKFRIVYKLWLILVPMMVHRKRKI